MTRQEKEDNDMSLCQAPGNPAGAGEHAVGAAGHAGAAR
eukprot:CAMPEP_0182907068 /NCGR_PEP_ID=MMETSP0034_2-20130328/34218_1 /TAXON_ID=156128 /ORGANISM="Nephroselmis pyriformis, Strain CCMP717" /LENGTH=38 /DNA_ID= /DNA_START= /DNA_END= /DNA_ORIENTATION=